MLFSSLFVLQLFTCFPYPPTLTEEEAFPTDMLAYLPWQELRDHQERTKASGSHRYACHQIVFPEHPEGGKPKAGRS